MRCTVKIAANNYFNEEKVDASGNPVPDHLDASPISDDGTSMELGGLVPCASFVRPEVDEALAGSTITITQTAGTGAVRILAIRPGAVAPFDDDWVEVPLGVNLRDDFYLSTGPYNTFDCYIEGLTPGSVELTFEYSRGGVICRDKVLLNVVEYDVIELRYKAFIACGAVSTGSIPGVTDFFKGDNRNFGYAGSPSRSFQSYFITVGPAIADGPLDKASRAFFGTTLGYNDTPTNIIPCPPGQVCPSFCTDCIAAGATPECDLTAQPGMNGNVLSADYTHVTDSLSEVVFDLVGKNPCVTGAPAIDADITFEFRQVYDTSTGVLGPMEWRIQPGSGSEHDAFPWHELYLNGVEVYRWDPCANGRTPNPNDLLPSPLGEDVTMPALLNEWSPVQ